MSTVPSDADMESLRNLLFDIESRLLRNGRTCQNLRQEVEMAQEINTKEQFQWIKVSDCKFCSLSFRQYYDPISPSFL